MKKIMIILLTIMSVTTVNAATKTEEIVDKLNELIESVDGIVNYADDRIEIEWNTPNSKSHEISFPYNGNIIEYNSGEITSYEEAGDVISHSIYATYLIKTTLKVNGYSDKEIDAFFNDEKNNFDYEINGIELKSLGEAKPFTSSDGLSTLTMSPVSIKIDVTRANLNTSTDAPFAPKTTTIEDIIDYLQSDSKFTTTIVEDKVIAENEINIDDKSITISNTSYWDDYHIISFLSEDNIISYEDNEIETYEDAEMAGSRQMFADAILSFALKMNGYTNEQIQEFILSNEFDYEVNGIEIKKIGEEKKYTNSEGDSIEVAPMLFKIDLAKANLDKKTINYEVIEGAKQIIDISKIDNLKFRFNIEYSKFKEYGKVYIDNELVDSSNYTSEAGSTVITFSSEYVKKLSAKEHTLKVEVSDGKVETTFTVTKTSQNPATGDNVISNILILGLSVIGLTIVGLFGRKIKFN